MGVKMDPVVLMQRYLARCEECGDCLLWQGPVAPRGGAPVVVGGGLRRRVWEMREGRIPKGMMVGVSCGRQRCIEHLCLVSRADLLLSIISRPEVQAKRTADATRRARFGGVNIPPKLTMEKAREIRASDRSHRELGKEYGISPSLVSMVQNNRRWAEEQVSPFEGLMR